MKDKFYHLFHDYRKSINWTTTIIYYILFTITHLMDGCTLARFLGISGVFLLMTLLAWLISKLEISRKVNNF